MENKTTGRKNPQTVKIGSDGYIYLDDTRIECVGEIKFVMRPECNMSTIFIEMDAAVEFSGEMYMPHNGSFSLEQYLKIKEEK